MGRPFRQIAAESLRAEDKLPRLSSRMISMQRCSRSKCYRFLLPVGIFQEVRRSKSFGIFGCPPGIRTPIC